MNRDLLHYPGGQTKGVPDLLLFILLGLAVLVSPFFGEGKSGHLLKKFFTWTSKAAVATGALRKNKSEVCAT